MSEELKLTKEYYSISEVAEMFGVAASLLRFWETEIPGLRPPTMRGTNVRRYEKKHIENIRTVYNLVKVRGFKISAAKRVFNGTKKKSADQNAVLLNELQEVRDYLASMRKQFNSLT